MCKKKMYLFLLLLGTCIYLPLKKHYLCYEFNLSVRSGVKRFHTSIQTNHFALPFLYDFFF